MASSRVLRGYGRATAGAFFLPVGAGSSAGRATSTSDELGTAAAVLVPSPLSDSRGSAMSAPVAASKCRAAYAPVPTSGHFMRRGPTLTNPLGTRSPRHQESDQPQR